MHAHAKTFLFAGASCLALYGAAFAYAPTEMADVYVLQNETMGTPMPQRGHRPSDAFNAAQRIRMNDAVWPVEKRGFTINGPGIVLHGVPGAPVVAAADGEVYGVYGPGDIGNPYPNEGGVVVLRHVADRDMPTNERPTRRYYTVYAGLGAAYLPSPAKDEVIAVTKGDPIGAVDDIGSPLHFEVRLRSLEGPRINPLALLPYDDRDTLAAEIVSTSPLTVRVTTDADELDVAEMLVQSDGVVRRYALGELPPSIIMETVDVAEEGRYGFIITFTDTTDAQSVVVRDVWGKGVRLTL